MLFRSGIGIGELVGLSCARTVDMLVGLLGILKAGAAYVPLDPTFPDERLRFMAEDARLRFVLVDSIDDLALRLPDVQALTVVVDAGSDTAPVARGGAEERAYVIYTSGSTGRPKGVQVSHRNVVNLLTSLRSVPGMNAGDRVLAVTTLSFDIAALELIMPLSVGATVVLADREQALDGRELMRLIETERVNFLQGTPSTWRLLLAAGWRGDDGFCAVVGGEPLPVDLGGELLTRVGALWNAYGPTETTVWSSFERVRSIAGPVPIGQPIANTRFEVHDEMGRVLPVGVVGELVIGGAGVTLGYLDRPQLDAERFVADAQTPGARCYRTGDLGRWRHDGVLECLGRADDQVKIRGFRVELGEVELLLLAQSEVARAVAVRWEDRPGDVRLVGYVVLHPGVAMPRDLRERLRKSVPDYMVPHHIVAIERVPQLPNGKIDRKSLPSPIDQTLTPTSDASIHDQANQIAQSAEGLGNAQLPNAYERGIMALWGEVIGVAPEKIGLDSDFFDIGGSSLLAMHVAIGIEERWVLRLAPSVLVDASTPRKLSAILAGTVAEEPLATLRQGKHDRPLFLVHDGFGEILLYRQLASSLASDQAVFGLRPAMGDDESPRFTRIQDMAAAHIAHIRRVQPLGPYALGGLCAGGVIAFEIALQLRRADQQVSVLALIDAADTAAETRVGLTTRRRWSRFKSSLGADFAVGGWAGMRQAIATAFSKLQSVLSYELGSRWAALVQDRQLRALQENRDAQRPLPSSLHGIPVWQAYEFAAGNYRPSGRLDAPVMLCRASAQQGDDTDRPLTQDLSDPLLGWGPHVEGTINCFDLPGGHSSMLQAPNVTALAQALERAMTAGAARMAR